MYRASSLAWTTPTWSVDLTTAVVELCESSVPGLVGSGKAAGQTPDDLPPLAEAAPALRTRTASVAADMATAANLFMNSPGEPESEGVLLPRCGDPRVRSPRDQKQSNFGVTTPCQRPTNRPPIQHSEIICKRTPSGPAANRGPARLNRGDDAVVWLLGGCWADGPAASANLVRSRCWRRPDGSRS